MNRYRPYLLSECSKLAATEYKTKFYKGVISDVIDGVKADFEDEGSELNALEELKRIWEQKLSETKAVDLESTESNALNASSYATILQTQKTVSGTTGSSVQRPNLVTAPSTLSQQHLVSTGSNQVSANKPNVVRVVTSSQHANNGGGSSQLYHPHGQQHVTHNQMLSNAAHVAQMALPNTIYPTGSQNNAQNTGQQQILPNRVNLTQGGTRSFQILRPTPEYRRLPYNHLASYSDAPTRNGGHRDGATYPIRPLPNYSYIRPPGHVLMGQNVLLQHGSQFGPLATSNAPAHPVSLSHISQNVINNSNGKPSSFMHQADGAGDSSSEDDDDDDLDDLVAVDHARTGTASRYGAINSRIPDFISPPDSLPPPHSTLTSVGCDGDDSDDDEDDDNNYDQKPRLADDEEKAESESGKEEEQPLNSEDDVSDEEADKLFETENVIVCQYDKINRSRNKWRFHLKDGIMNLKGKDRLFQKANGDAEW